MTELLLVVTVLLFILGVILLLRFGDVKVRVKWLGTSVDVEAKKNDETKKNPRPRVPRE